MPIVKVPFQPFSSSFILNPRLSPNITLINTSKNEWHFNEGCKISLSAIIQLSSPERPRGQIKYTHFNFTHAIAVQRMQACARKLLSCSYFGTMYFQEFYDTVFCEKWSHKEM